MIYFGSLGRMVGVSCPSVQSVSVGSRYATTRTLEGRVLAQAGPVGRRSWDLRLPITSKAAEVATLRDFTSGAWGVGPFRFISTEAPVTNLLPPSVAACMPGQNPSVVIYPGGPMVQPGGSWSARSYVSPRPDLIMFFGVADGPGFGPGHAAPVVAGETITAAATVLGDNAHVVVRFYDHADESVGTRTSSVRSTAGTAVRSTVTAVVPSGAVSCRVTASNTVQGSNPQITWTDQPVDFTDGRGCLHAIVSESGSDLVMTSHDGSRPTLEGVSFSVQEVG